MKSRQRASAKRYRIVFGKTEAGVFALILCAGMAVSFSLGYIWGTRGASNEVAKTEVAPEPKVLDKGGEKEAERSEVVAQKKMPDLKPQAPNKTADAIQPKFYQDLLKENQENEQPIEPIKLPVVKKIIPPKPTPPLVAAVEKPPEEKKPLDEQADEKSTEEKKENTNRPGNDAQKQVEGGTRASKPWTKASGYTIQVVSVKKFDEALRVVQKLRDAGFQPFIKNVDLGTRGKWYRVRVGHYRDRTEAQKALSDMQVKIKLRQAIIATM